MQGYSRARCVCVLLVGFVYMVKRDTTGEDLVAVMERDKVLELSEDDS